MKISDCRAFSPFKTVPGCRAYSHSDIIMCRANSGKCELGIAALNFCVYWLRDDASLLHFVDSNRTRLIQRQKISYVLFVFENTLMFSACHLYDNMSVKNYVGLAFGMTFPVTLVTYIRAGLISSYLYEN